MNCLSISAAALIIPFTGIFASQTPDSTYTLTGTIKGVPSGRVYLLHAETQKLDSARVSNNKFVFSGTAGTPEFCMLGFPGSMGKKEFPVEFFLQSGDLQFSSKEAMGDAAITGGSVQDEFRQYQEKEKGAVKATLDAAITTAVGKPALEFTQNDSKGKPVTLSSFRGQYVLIDFWASWCGPCRAENPAVVKAYHAWHSKGFTILSVSLDDNKDRWLAAIKKDGLDWTQVSDLKSWQNSVATLYGVQGIPMNFLLDKDGKIIAKGLRGDDLEKKLTELVH